MTSAINGRAQRTSSAIVYPAPAALTLAGMRAVGWHPPVASARSPASVVDAVLVLVVLVLAVRPAPHLRGDHDTGTLEPLQPRGRPD